MISALLWGAGLGVGLWALVVYVFPPRPPLRALVDRLHATPAPPPILTADSDGWALRVGRPFIKPLAALGLPNRKLRNDLAVTGKSIEHHLAEKATLALTGLLLPILMHLLLVVADVGLGWEVPRSPASSSRSAGSCSRTSASGRKPSGAAPPSGMRCRPTST
ncbi:hypothetical protein ACFSVJ_21765 [Prauserella oleivorans]